MHMVWDRGITGSSIVKRKRDFRYFRNAYNFHTIAEV
jgi:hypothetical protein